MNSWDCQWPVKTGRDRLRLLGTNCMLGTDSDLWRLVETTLDWQCPLETHVENTRDLLVETCSDWWRRAVTFREWQWPLGTIRDWLWPVETVRDSLWLLKIDRNLLRLVETATTWDWLEQVSDFYILAGGDIQWHLETDSDKWRLGSWTVSDYSRLSDIRWHYWRLRATFRDCKRRLDTDLLRHAMTCRD